MNRFSKSKWLAALPVLGLALHSTPVLACAACYGKSGSALAQGMNWGIFSLLGVVVCVLGAVATFFIYLARKAASVAAQTPAPAELPTSTQKV